MQVLRREHALAIAYSNNHPSTLNAKPELVVQVTRREHALAFSNGMEYFATCGGCTAAGAAGLAVMSVVASEGLQARPKNPSPVVASEGLQARSKNPHLWSHPRVCRRAPESSPASIYCMCVLLVSLARSVVLTVMFAVAAKGLHARSQGLPSMPVLRAGGAVLMFGIY